MSPFLNKGITWAIFQSDGNTFSRKDLLNKLHNGFDISSFTDTNILLLIISGPTALLALRVHNISITSCSVAITWDNICSHLSWESGKTASSSFNLVIEQNYLFKALDFWVASYAKLKLLNGSWSGGNSLVERSLFSNMWIVFQYISLFTVLRSPRCSLILS